jgi:hypothetical protein
MATDNLILEHLRAIRGQLDRLDGRVEDIGKQIISLRLHDHARDGDDIRRDKAIAELQVEVDRIRRRLDLAPGEDA